MTEVKKVCRWNARPFVLSLNYEKIDECISLGVSCFFILFRYVVGNKYEVWACLEIVTFE